MLFIVAGFFYAPLGSFSTKKAAYKNDLTAFTVNFLEVTKQSGISPMPFLEASKAMNRGIGYAGEGDVLTALVGSLLSVYPDSTFTEMFCPDWSNNSWKVVQIG